MGFVSRRKMTTPDSLASQPLAASELPADGEPGPIIAAERTAWRLAFVDFPWDINKALEFALLRTYAVPSISGLLARTGVFVIGRPNATTIPPC